MALNKKLRAWNKGCDTKEERAMINVSKLKEGIVIDHIRAGTGIKFIQQLGLDQLDDVVVLMRNVTAPRWAARI
jgi:aspartate carbamoyltransferase regulatory subunit